MAPGVMWTKEDCDKLNHLVELHGKKWTPIASTLGGGKTGKQCRRQWERLNIITKQCGWAPEEDALLLEFHKRYGNKWTRISKMIGGRTDNAVKNRYHALKLKRRTKSLTRVDSTQSKDTNSGKRCLKNCSSLEERRAAKEKAERIKETDGVQFKSEEPYKTGYFGNFDRFAGACLSKYPWTQPMEICIPRSSPYGMPQPRTNDGPTRFLMNLTDPVHPAMAPSLISDSTTKMADDADSMESSSDNRITAMPSQSECLSAMYDGGSFVSTCFLGTYSHPLPSRVLEPPEMANYGLTHSEPIPLKKNADLTLDLTFQQKSDGFDFDSFLHSVSPMSPNAYIKFLNSLSPMNSQPPCMPDHESHMKA